MTKKKYPTEEPVLSRKALLRVLDDRSEVTNLIQDRPYTCITVRSWYDGKEYIGFGFSKVMYPDYWEGETGADIAYKRALIKIMHQVRGHERAKRRMEAFDICVNSVNTKPTIDELLDQYSEKRYTRNYE